MTANLYTVNKYLLSSCCRSSVLVAEIQRCRVNKKNKIPCFMGSHSSGEENKQIIEQVKFVDKCYDGIK